MALNSSWVVAEKPHLPAQGELIPVVILSAICQAVSEAWPAWEEVEAEAVHDHSISRRVVGAQGLISAIRRAYFPSFLSKVVRVWAMTMTFSLSFLVGVEAEVVEARGDIKKRMDTGGIEQ